MSKLRRQLSVGTSNTVETKNLDEIKNKTGNLYESIHNLDQGEADQKTDEQEEVSEQTMDSSNVKASPPEVQANTLIAKYTPDGKLVTAYNDALISQ